MNAAQLIPIIAITVCCSFALYSFIVDFLMSKQHAKNKIKQVPTKKGEADKVLADVTHGFAPRSCEERCYKDFDKMITELLN